MLGLQLRHSRALQVSSDHQSLELAPCRFAQGDDAQMLHVLTLPTVVHYAKPLQADWSARTLLLRVANWTPPLHAKSRLSR